MATWTLDYCNSYQNGWSITFMGDKGPGSKSKGKKQKGSKKKPASA